MQLDTFLKLGSLAMNVAQDNNVRELFSMLHQGAKRRGMFQPELGMMPPKAASSQKTEPKVEAATPAQKPSAPPIPFAPSGSSFAHLGGSGVGKYLTVDNAKRVMNLAGVVKQFMK